MKSEIDFTNYDVVILNSEDILYASYIQQINPEVKIIWWVHNEYDIIMNRRLGDATNEVRNNLKFVDTVVTLTEFDKREFEDLHKNVVTIKNPLTINQGKVLSSLDSRVISFTSRLVFEQKGLDLLVQIAKKIEPGWKISVAGDGPDRQMFLQLIEKEKISDKFIFEGMLDKEALRLHYLNSSLFISTSRWEGFGLVITEAMSCGLPIISFDNKGPREILANGEFGILIEKYNIYDFVEKINYLISSKEYRRELANKSLERVKEYSLTKVTEEWKGIL